jgi:nitrogen fixation/metabolism regulation signal transduction histidine kinase
MADKSLIRVFFGPVSAVVLSLVLILTLFLLTSAAQHAKVTGEFYSILLAVNIMGIVTLLALIAGNLWRLWRQFRSQVLGSRLTLRMVGMFVLLVVLPLSMVYYFSVQFLSKGVDSWFDVRVEQAVDDALLLGQTTLETIKQDAVDKVLESAARLAESTSSLETIQLLDEEREQREYLELSLYTTAGRIIASSHQEAQFLIPDTPDEAILSQVRQGQRYVSLEPRSADVHQLRIVVPVYSGSMGEPIQVLQALELLPLRYAKLANSVESALAQYRQMVFSRGPLKFSLILTLTLVTLVAMLLAVWGAILISRHMASPLRDLAEGTRAVAEGNYRKKLPVTSGDELGVLVKSFNEMTRQINRAQNAARRSQREAEDQRAYLEALLGHLSSGVLSFDRQRRLLTRNVATAQILGVDLASAEGEALDDIRRQQPRFEPLFAAIDDAVRRGLADWQAEITIFGKHGRQVLMVRGAKITGKGAKRGGFVVLFDDVTDLIQAQRDAAWGEVARRLAHEIKNPLTPIQLSAERIRNKYLDKVEPGDRTTLDRATRTIAQQVESMKDMVNAFSSYAQPVKLELNPVNLNQLVQDVAELHQREDSPLRISFDLAEELPPLNADIGRLRQVLNNLFINARDALVSVTEPELKLLTRSVVESDRQYIELEVIDNGPGIPDDIMDRLFEPYVTTKDKGTGLGLAIVKRIVEEHGGAIWVENKSGGGVKMTVRFPVVWETASNVTDLNIRLARKRRVGGKTA